MESTGNESFFRHPVISETADGDLWLAADMVRLLVHRVFLCALAGRGTADVVVGSASAGCLARFPHTRQVDGCATDSLGSHRNYEC